MEREGERPRIQGKSLNATSRRERSGERVLFAGKLLSALLAVVLAAGLLPIVPASPVVEEAEALAGTTNYGDFFTIGHRGGRPGSISGNTLRGASTQNYWDYEYRDNRWMSSSVFISKRPVSLLHDWTVNVHANLSEPEIGRAHV